MNNKILFINIHSILSGDADSFKFCVNFLYSFVPFFGMNKSTNFLIGAFLYNFACHGFSVFLTFAFVELTSFTLRINI